jgi:hypothetical protein
MNVTLMLAGIVRSTSRGQLIPVFGLSLAVLMGMGALAVDVGYWRYEHRLEQSAADSAAMAGAGEISFPASNDVLGAARNDATSNGFTSGVSNATVTVNWPPLSGPNTGNNNAVEVIVAQVEPTFFSGIFGHSQTVQARAVAVMSPANSGCIYVLKGDFGGNLTLHGGGGGGITTVPLCGMVVNGNLTVTGQANVDVSYISYAGTGPGGGSYPDGQPVHGVAGTDPCTRLPGCGYLATLTTTNPGLFSVACQDPGNVLPASPLPPGHYCGGTVNGQGAYTGPYTAAVTLQPGLFIMDQGMFAGQTSGTGVTIYNNCTVTSKNNCSTTLSGGNVDDTIVAPLTGVTAGMVYYQPPTLKDTITVNGASGTVSAVGGVYAPGADFTFNGQLPTISFLVAGTITMNGGGLDAGSTAGGFPLPGNAVLTE